MKTKNLQHLKSQQNYANANSIEILLKKLCGIINLDSLNHVIHENRPLKSSLLLPFALILIIIPGFFIQGYSHSNINRYESSIGPDIVVGTLTDFGNQCINTVSVIQSYTVSGTSLTNTLVITPPSGFEISLPGPSFSAAPYINLHPDSDGSIPEQTIYVRFIPALAQIYSANIIHSSTDATTQNVEVTGTGFATPVAAFTGTPTTVTVGGNVTFTDNSSNTPTSWLWSFPGGTPSSSTDQYPSVTYNIAGNYNVSLIATNDCGFDEETQTEYITVTSPCTNPVADEPSGYGTSLEPYQIASLQNLYWIAANKETWDKYFIQTENIDASETADWCTGGWLPIGNWYVDEGTENRVFSGSYDGQGNTILGLHMKDNSNYVAFGLFGTARGATIKNLGLIDVSINISPGSNSTTGTLVGISAGSLVENCYSTGNLLNQSSDNCGGLVGENLGGSSVIDSYSSCNVTGTHATGGLVGVNNNSSITNCYYLSGIVDGSGSEYSTTGGLAGMNYNYGSISKCYSTGMVTGYEYAGGLVGSNISNAQISDCFSRCSVSSAIESWRSAGFVGENDATITNCYSTGQVSGIRIRGFVGGWIGGAIVNCFWDIETSGALLSEGGEGKTSAEMNTQSTFTDWDFTTIWGISESINDGYPHFQTESAPCLGYAYAIEFESGVTNSSNVLGMPDGEVASLSWLFSGSLDLDLTGEEPERAPGTTITVIWRKNGETSPNIDIDIQNDGTLTGWTTVFENLVVENSELQSFEIPISFDTRYIVFYMNNDAILDIDAITYNCNCIAPTPAVSVENFCGNSVLTASGYTGELIWSKRTPYDTWITLGTTASITVDEPGIYTVNQKDGDCLSLSGWAEVDIINEPEQPGPISGLATPCLGGVEVYSISPVTGATNYQWYVPENWIIKNGQGTPEITVQTGVTYDITEDAVSVHVSNDYCPGVKSSLLAVQSITAPAQPGTISGPEIPCEKTEVVYSIAPANGATFYYWILPQGWEITEGHGTTQITVLTGPNNETQSIISVSAGNDCFYSESTNLNVQSKICCTQGEPDMYEDNNTLQTAALIKVGDPAISANILNSKDADWFYFVTGDAGLYQINHVPGSTLEIMALYNSLARKLKPAERNGTAYSLLANTAYYIKVSARLKTPAPCYSLGVEFVVSASFASEQYDDLKSAEIETITEDFYKVWPNPSNNQFNFYNGLGIPVELKITDFTGRTVEFIKNIGLSKTVLFGEKYVSGLYFIEISGDGVKEIFKAVKQ